MKKEFTKKDLKTGDIMVLRNGEPESKMIGIIAQAFYGNRTYTEIRPEEVDAFIHGLLGGPHTPIDTSKRTIVRIPGTENLVMIYDADQEEKTVRWAEDLQGKEGHTMKPLAEIPELGLKLYSRCIVCRMNNDGELESLEGEDSNKFMKYLAR